MTSVKAVGHDRTLGPSRIPLSREPLVPSPEEVEESKRLLEAARGMCEGDVGLRLRSHTGSSKSIALSARVGRFMMEALSQIAEGNAIKLVPIQRELTTHKAADLLNISRTYLIGLLDNGEIPYRMVGSHRRIALAALLAYREKTDHRRKQALADIAAEAQELKLYE
jgi:excisionase family DNA binding protein